MQQPTERKPKFKFIELYAGFKGFSTAMAEVVGENVEVLKPLELYDGWDVLTPEGLEEARKAAREADHLHVAIPCRSFTRARRVDAHGVVATVRSDERPEGWGHPVAEEGNRHLEAIEVIVMEAARAGCSTSIENPWDSFLWETAKMKRLTRRLHLTPVYLEQCAYGGMSRKPTRILTDAEWMKTVQLTCGQVRPHCHSKLEGKVWDPVTEGMVWKTSKAAEYPSGLCRAWATALKDHLEAKPIILQKKTFEKVGAHQHVLVRADLKRRSLTGPVGTQPSAEDGPKKTKLLTFKERREAENERSIGGLRNPRAAVSRNSHLRTTGMRLRKVLDTALTSRALQDFQQRPTESPFSSEAMTQIREALALEFNTTATHRGYEKSILQSVLEQSHDLDAKVIPKWLNEGFPLGIIHPIPHTGIFPQTEDVSDAIRMSALCGRVVRDWDGTALNYESFYQAGEKAQREIDRMLTEGWAEIVPTWAQVAQRFGPEARLTPIACIIKQSHGKEKVRLVVDMRRSSVNGLMTVKERVVLPRVSDVAKSVQALAYSDSYLLELLCIDFKDAFYTMPAHHAERGYLVVKDTQGRYICIKVCAFGLASAPLLWCRLAACIMRLAQATHHDWECRISCYVDDPIVVACGQTSMERTRIMFCCAVFSCGHPWDSSYPGARSLEASNSNGSASSSPSLGGSLARLRLSLPKTRSRSSRRRFMGC